MPHDLETAAAWLNERGYLVNNCFQLEGGKWRINVRRMGPPGTNTHDFADGPTIQTALETLLKKRVTSENRLADAFDALTAAVKGSSL